MELLNVATARAAWLFDVNELNPRGKSFFSDLLDWLKDSYNFEQTPSSSTDVDKDTKAWTFLRGTFQVADEIFVDVNLKIFIDGLVADTWSSTRHSAAFLEDVLRSASEEFHLVYKPETVRVKNYLSEINVRSTMNPLTINPKLGEFAEKISRLANHEFEFGGLAFWPRQLTFPARDIASFCLERKLKTDRDEGKYFSRAPFHTDDHMRILEEIEQAFSG